MKFSTTQMDVCLRAAKRRKPQDVFVSFAFLVFFSDGRNRGARDRPKKKGRAGNWAIDPLDPTGKTGGKWSDGLVQVRTTVERCKVGVPLTVVYELSKVSLERQR